MINYLKKSLPSFFIGCILGFPIALCGINYQEPNSTPIKEIVINEQETEYSKIFNQKVKKPEPKGVKQHEIIILPVNMSEETQEMIIEISNKYDIAYTLTIAVIEHESECDADAISKTGDYGLMQINQINHELLSSTLGISDFADSKQNVEAGCYMFNELFKKYKDVNLALMAYNMGENGASKLWEQGIYTSKYADEIIQREIELSQYIDERVGGNEKMGDY
ncbi:MAG: transglycosylase SLT domain-containing protein [Lachnotalea sp.]